METNENRENGNSLAGKLVICDSGKLRQLPLTGDIFIGHVDAPDRIFLEGDCVADLHGKLVKLENGFGYQDLESTNGTYLNGCRIGTGNLRGQEVWPLEDGDVLKIRGEALENTEKDNEIVLIYRRRFVEDTEWHSVDLADTSQEIRIMRHDDEAGREEALKADGQAPEHYATLTFRDGQWRLGDHSTRYGVFLDNCRISAEEAIAENDVMRIGSTLFLYRRGKLWYNHRERSESQLSIRIEERSVWNWFRKKVLLEDINVTVNPGEMVLILGGSGAGKTTFINAVMGYEKAEGKITEGGVDVYKNYDKMKYEIGFVPQQDLLRLEDTVYETLSNAAELKMPKDTPDGERKARVDEVLERFGLDHEAQSLVEKLSGGQRKRLSIAIEFVADPWLFFLDEPDSGLDGVMARSLMENLRRIADEKRIVMVITHSPDRVAELFDKVLVLAKSEKDGVGHLAFYGLIDEAKDFFGTDSLEGIIKKVNRTDEGGEGMADAYIGRFKALNDPEEEKK